MEVHNMHEAKTNLSRLVDKAIAGESVYICKRGSIVVQLIPVKKGQKKRIGGQWLGQVEMSKDFDELPPEFLDAFSGKMP